MNEQDRDTTATAPSGATTKARRLGRAILALVFAILAVNALVGAVLDALRIADDPPLLGAMQAVVALAAATAGWGTWIAARWAPAAALGYGVLTAIMILALGPLLALDPVASRALWAGAALLLAFGIWAAWYLRRAARRDG